MITTNFKQAMKMILTNYNSRNEGGIEVKNTSGSTKYLMVFDGWPSSSSVSKGVVINSNNSPGIWVGSGSTPESESSYTLDSRITSGLTANNPTFGSGVDESGNPQMKLVIMLTNTSSSSITVAEIGFFQQIRLANSASGSSGTLETIMLDRTLLDTPVTIPAGESAAITYTLKTVIS